MGFPPSSFVPVLASFLLQKVVMPMCRSLHFREFFFVRLGLRHGFVGPPLLGRRRRPQSERTELRCSSVGSSTEPSPGEELDSPAAPGKVSLFYHAFGCGWKGDNDEMR